MIAPTSEHNVVGLETNPLSCDMVAQHICRAAEPKMDEWVEFLVRASGTLQHVPPFEFVHLGYKRRGLFFDQDIVRKCLSYIDDLQSHTSFSINVHPSSLYRDRFVDFMLEQLELHKVEPSRLVLELVEFGGPVDLMASRSAIEALRSRGVRFALDDFGPGFSNLDLVASELIDFVKLDRSLVRFADMQSGYRRLIQGLQALAGQTGVVLVAEGVETAVQSEIIRDIGIEWIQGFFYSRPESILLQRSAGGAVIDVIQ